jgi:hypothetical protein
VSHEWPFFDFDRRFSERIQSAGLDLGFGPRAFELKAACRLPRRGPFDEAYFGSAGADAKVVNDLILCHAAP